MKKLFALLVCSLPLWATGAYSQAIPRDEEVERQVEALLSGLTLEQKVGQMCELAIDLIANNSSDDHVQSNKATNVLAGGMLSADAVNRVFGQFYVGSILNVPEGVAQTPERWADVIRTCNNVSAFHCNDIPQLYGVDQIHGASYTYGATLFPQEISQGASFNVLIPRRIGEITAYESRACLIPWVYSPVMDVARTPLWPRMWESFGEDVLVNSRMATEFTLGLQGTDPNHIGMYNVAACLKHYLAYGAAVSGKDRTPSSVTEREMMEKYFLPFKACAEAGALSIMVNSANNNGVPFHANHKLLTEWFKEGLNWDGMIVTDWADIDNLWKRDHVAKDKKDAICMAINAGIDMSMDPYDTGFCTLLQELVEEGRVPMSRIDDAVRRILRLKIRVGLMDRNTWDIPYDVTKTKTKTKNRMQPRDLKSMYREFGSDGFAQEAVKMAEECMVLLKNENKNENENLLPLKKGTKIFVCGPNADNFRTMNGGWSYTWQGDKTDQIAREIGKYNTFLSALENKFGKENVEYSQMVAYDNGADWRTDHQVPELLIENGQSTGDKIARADVIVAVIGENTYTETPGNIDDLNISQNQIDMVKALAETGKPIILVLNEGRPRLITEIEPLAKAVVHTFLPGNYGGDALANLLAGDANFSGKMPFTYPKHHGSFATYDYKPCENMATMGGAYNYDAKMDVLYTFGQGLSYTTYEYSNLRVQNNASIRKNLDDCGFVEVSVDVKNTGRVAGKEPVLVFVSDMVATLTPDVKRLRAFDKVELQPGETKTVSFEIKAKDLAFVNTNLEWTLEPGDFRVSVGNQSKVFELK